MKIPYFPGCALKTKATNYEMSAISSAKVLNLEMVELPRWNCCGTVYSLVDDNIMQNLAAVRDLIRVQEINEEGMMNEETNRLITLCPCCYNTLKRTDMMISNDLEKLKTINTVLDREIDYKGEVQVVHYLEVLKEVGFSKIRDEVKKPLTEIKIAPYYGCMLLRPKEVGIDDPEDPIILTQVLRSLGSTVIDTPYKTKCCGSYLTVNEKRAVVEMTYDKLTYCQKAGVEVVAVTCPLCAFNLDNRQAEVKELHPDFQTMPILYFTQFMALAFGLDEESFGFNSNYIDPKPLLRAKGLLDLN